VGHLAGEQRDLEGVFSKRRPIEEFDGTEVDIDLVNIEGLSAEDVPHADEGNRRAVGSRAEAQPRLHWAIRGKFRPEAIARAKPTLSVIHAQLRLIFYLGYIITHCDAGPKLYGELRTFLHRWCHALLFLFFPFLPNAFLLLFQLTESLLQ